MPLWSYSIINLTEGIRHVLLSSGHFLLLSDVMPHIMLTTKLYHLFSNFWACLTCYCLPLSNYYGLMARPAAFFPTGNFQERGKIMYHRLLTVLHWNSRVSLLQLFPPETMSSVYNAISSELWLDILINNSNLTQIFHWYQCITCVVWSWSIGHLIPIRPKISLYCICINSVTCGFVSLGEQAVLCSLFLTHILSLSFIYISLVIAPRAQEINNMNTSSLSVVTVMTTVYHQQTDSQPSGPDRWCELDPLDLGVYCENTSKQLSTVCQHPNTMRDVTHKTIYHGYCRIPLHCEALYCTALDLYCTVTVDKLLWYIPLLVTIDL